MPKDGGMVKTLTLTIISFETVHQQPIAHFITFDLKKIKVKKLWVNREPPLMVKCIQLP